MKFSVAAVTLAAGVSATYPVSSAPAGNVTYTTEIVTSYETYCPGPTQITYGSQTYTVTEPTTLTITDCPCTVSKPVYTTSSVICSTCTSEVPVETPVYPTATPEVPTSYSNGTATVPTSAASTVYPTGGVPTTPTTSATSVPTAGAGKAAAFSGAGLAGLIGLAAFAL